MALDLNINPYYDDFDENKNYHKILFKPGNAIQARELTQIQTILQDQIGKLGKFVLSEGSRVYGAQIFSDYDAVVIRLSIEESNNINVYNFKNLYVVGATSKLAGYIFDIDYNSRLLFVKLLNTTSSNLFLQKETLHIFSTKDLALSYVINDLIEPQYTSVVDNDISVRIQNVTGLQYSNNLSLNTLTLEVGDVISSSELTQNYTVTDIIDGNTCVLNRKLEKDITNITVNSTKFSSTQVLQIGISEGVFFSNGYFVKNLPQSIIPNPKTKYSSAVVGFEIVETIVDFVDDSSLLDPALGASNYSSPGADRYVIELKIVSKPLVDDVLQELTDNKFIELVRIKRGEIIKINLNPTLGEIEKTLARQMDDHAGSFTVTPFRLSFSELELNSSSNTISYSISPGKAYIFGHEFETTYPVSIQSTKARTTNKVTNFNLQTYYGNSIQIKDLYGNINFLSSPTVELHSVTSNQSANTKIGTAQSRNIKYLSENNYNIYFYDIKLNKVSTISNVKSVLSTTTANNYSSFIFKANTVLNTSNNAVLVDSTNDYTIFQYPHNNITNITNIEYDSNIILNKNFSDNSTVLYSGDLSKQILGGIGTIPSEIKKQYFRIVAKSTNGSYTQNEEIDLDDTIITISATTNEYVATIELTNAKTYNGFAEIYYTVHNQNAKPKIKTLNTNKIVCVNANTLITSLGYSDIYKVNNVYKLSANSVSAFKGSWDNSTTYNNGEYVSYNNSIYLAISNNINKSPVENNTIWFPQSPVSSNYNVTTGQNPSYYDHGNLVLSKVSDYGIYVVSFDYFSHSSGGFLTQSSYPISYRDIPSFSFAGKSFNLRDCLDFRPRRKDNSATLIFDSFEIPATTFSSCFSDYEYYLPKIDRLVLSENKKFRIIQGIPKLNPEPPKIPENTLNLALIFYDAYGFSADDINFRYDDHRRYTMDDIGILDKRISRSEYYTSLTISESGVLNKTSTDSLLSQRLNSGFFVDGFYNINLVDFFNPFCMCTLDVLNGICKPRVSYDSLNLRNSPTNDYWQHRDIYHLPFTVNGTDAIVVSNLIPTGSVTANPFKKVNFFGTLTIFPDSDNWFDEKTTTINNVQYETIQGKQKVYGGRTNIQSSSPVTTNPAKSFEDKLNAENTGKGPIFQGNVVDGVWIPYNMMGSKGVTASGEEYYATPLVVKDPETGKLVVTEAGKYNWEVYTNQETGDQKILSTHYGNDFVRSGNQDTTAFSVTRA